jgi:hypothetical protein
MLRYPFTAWVFGPRRQGFTAEMQESSGAQQCATTSSLCVLQKRLSSSPNGTVPR